MTYISEMPSPVPVDNDARRDSRITEPVPEHDVLQGPWSPQQGLSPFEQAVGNMTYSQQGNWPRAAPPSMPKKKGLFARFSCCMGGGQNIETVDSRATACSYYSTDDSNALDAAMASTLGPLPAAGQAGRVVNRRLSGHKTWDYVPPGQAARKYSRQTSVYSDADWFDAMSQLSDSRSVNEADLDDIADYVQALSQGFTDSAPRSLSYTRPPWMPDPPLIFAPADLQFVPVPKHTGFAAYWENDMTRTTPHPQPIDVMIGASYLVKQVHKSIPGLWVQENDSVVTVVAKPKLVPPGYTAYMEVYDKSNATEPMWSPRRDLNWGSCSGQVYMTSEGVLILRAFARPAFSSEVEFITEDYLVLEQGGAVVVDRMCCVEVATGRKAVQYQVGMRRDKPPFGWGAAIGPHYKPDRVLDKGQQGQQHRR